MNFTPSPAREEGQGYRELATTQIFPLLDPSQRDLSEMCQLRSSHLTGCTPSPYGGCELDLCSFSLPLPIFLTGEMPLIRLGFLCGSSFSLGPITRKVHIPLVSTTALQWVLVPSECPARSPRPGEEQALKSIHSFTRHLLTGPLPKERDEEVKKPHTFALRQLRF